MGRTSVIDQLESKFGKPIQDVMEEAVSHGDYKAISEYLGVQKSSVYKLMDQCGLKKRNGNGTIPMDLDRESESELARLTKSFLMTKEIGGKTEATLRFYGDNMNRFAWWLDQEKIPQEIGAITTDVVRKFLYYVQTAPVRFGGHSPAARKPAGRTTVDAYYRTLQAFFTWAVREGLVKEEHNPMKRIDKPGQNKVVIPEIETDVLEKLLDSFGDNFEGRRNRAVTLILLDTGIRFSELAGLSLDDLNLETGLVKVFGKGRKERFVRMDEYTIEAVRSYLDCWDQVTNNPPDALWITNKGEPMTKDGLNSLIRRFNQVVPGAHITPHKFRHTFAILYLRNRGDLATLQDNGGWADLSMPNRYAAARKQEDAHKAHETASPVRNLIGGRK